VLNGKSFKSCPQKHLLTIIALLDLGMAAHRVRTTFGSMS
jgi:hypothetical protein